MRARRETRGLDADRKGAKKERGSVLVPGAKGRALVPASVMVASVYAYVHAYVCMYACMHACIYVCI